VFKATPARAALARRLTTLPTLLAWLKELEAEGGASPLLFGRDVNAARYRDGVRETPNGPGEADAAALKVLHDQEGCTLQVAGAGCRGRGLGVLSHGVEQWEIHSDQDVCCPDMYCAARSKHEGVIWLQR
jgi:hypothetical protein